MVVIPSDIAQAFIRRESSVGPVTSARHRRSAIIYGAMCALGLDRNILWGSDYPHFDCTYPGAVRQVEAALRPLSQSARDHILRDNAQRFYNLAPWR